LHQYIEAEKVQKLDLLNLKQAEFVRRYFKEKVCPVLSPIILSNVGEFPYLKDKYIYLAIILTSSEPDIASDYALIEIPTDVLPRFIVLPSENEKKFIILLEDVIRYNLDQVFGLFRYDHFDSWIIKLTRDAELDMDNDISKSFLELISTGINNRKTGQPVRFVFDNSIDKELLDYIESLGQRIKHITSLRDSIQKQYFERYYMNLYLFNRECLLYFVVG